MSGPQNATFTCLKFSLDCCKWMPIVVLTILIGYSYYAYNVVFCFNIVENLNEKCVYIVFYHVLLLLLLITYARVIVEPYQLCPKEFHLSSDELYKYLEKSSDRKEAGEYMRTIIQSRNLPIYTCNEDGYPRYCIECALIKPDRAHHCSACHMCHLKMDHHCVWVNTCVALHNYKFFVQLLFHGSLFCTYIMATSAKYFVRYWITGPNGTTMNNINLAFLFIVSGVFLIVLLCLLSYHSYLVFRNETSLESSRAPKFNSGIDSKGYDLGAYENFKEVFGNNPCGWFFPFGKSRSDGTNWVMRLEHYHMGYRTL